MRVPVSWLKIMRKKDNGEPLLLSVRVASIKTSRHSQHLFIWLADQAVSLKRFGHMCTVCMDSKRNPKHTGHQNHCNFSLKPCLVIEIKAFWYLHSRFDITINVQSINTFCLLAIPFPFIPFYISLSYFRIIFMASI